MKPFFIEKKKITNENNNQFEENFKKMEEEASITNQQRDSLHK